MKKIFTLAVIVAMISGCQYLHIVPDPIPADVSFSTNVAPIFTANCIGCHTSGGQVPDLTAANAWNSLTSQNLVDTSNPTASILYVKINTGAMPPGGSLSQTQIEMILKWIQQGAKNN